MFYIFYISITFLAFFEIVFSNKFDFYFKRKNITTKREIFLIFNSFIYISLLLFKSADFSINLFLS